MKASDALPIIKQSDRPSILISLAFGHFLGFLGIVNAPFWVGGIVAALNLSASTSGMVASIEFALFGIASLATAAVISRFDRRALAYAALGLALIGEIASYLAPGFASIALARAITGVGEGILLASVNASAAATINVQRSFAVMAFALAALGLTCHAVTPLAIGAFGPKGIFILLIVMKVLGFGLLRNLPRKASETVQKGARSGLRLETIASLFGYALFMAGGFSLWSYFERVGHAQGISLNTIAAVLSTGSLCALLGPIAADWLGVRYGRRLPLIIGLLITGSSPLLLFWPMKLIGFAAGEILFTIVGQFCIVYFLSLFAEEDPAGRAVAASPAFMSIGTTIGPAIAGLSIAHLGMLSVIIVAFAFHVLAAALIVAIPWTVRIRNVRSKNSRP